MNKHRKTSLFLKKGISAYISALILISSLTVGIMSAGAQTSTVWDGTKASSSSFDGGDGTQSNPFLISNASQLAYIATAGQSATSGKYYKITKDIRINDTTIDNWKSSAKNWVWADARFAGHLDGAGYTIDGLYFNTNEWKRGLFSYVGGGSIKSLKFTNASINTTYSGDGSAGIVAGQLSAAESFSYIYIDETCEINAPGARGVAAIAPWGGNGTTIDNCAVLTNKIVGGEYTGAFMGTLWSGTKTITNCFTSSNLPISGNQSFIGSNNYALVADKNDSGTTVLSSADDMKGTVAEDNMPNLDFDCVWKITEDSYPVLLLREEVIPKGVWDGTKVSSLDSLAGGRGTKDDPYLIATAEQLAYVVSTDLKDGLCFKLTSDIKINDTSKNKWKNKAKNWVWKDVRFVGTFDGDGHTIDGLYFNTNEWKRGLFSYVGDSLIRNIKFTNASINTIYTGQGSAGIVVGQLSAPTQFEYIYIDETCEINAPGATGVAAIAPWGGNGTTIDNCAVLTNKIVGGEYTGAFIGTLWSGTKTITNCFTSSNLPISGNQAFIGSNNYALVADKIDSGTTVLSSVDDMKGTAAEDNMFCLDFDCVWKIGEDGYPELLLREDTSAVVWDGKKADSFAGGTGTQSDPYLIENGGQLYKMVADYSNTSISKKPESHTYFKIVKDIDLGNKQWYTTGITSYPDNANYSVGFSGIIYGDGHKIKRLYSNNKSSAVVGLIPVATQGAEIYDLHLEKGNLPKAEWNTYAVGAFIGLAKGTGNSTPIIIKGCSVEKFSIASRDASSAFVAYTQSQSVGIYNCSCVNNIITQTGTNNANSSAFIAVAGGNDYLNKITVSNSYCANVSPLIYAKDSMSKIVTFENVYTSSSSYDNSVPGIYKLTDEQMKGDNAKQYMQGLDFGLYWKFDENSYPRPVLYVKPDYVWDGTTAKEFAGGTGKPSDPYLIGDGAQLYKMVKEYSNASGESGADNKTVYFKLIDDIYLNDVTDNDLINPSEASWSSKFNSWYSVSSYSKGFCGELDGDGYTVYGLYSNTGYSGLIPVLMDGGSIHNLNLKNSYIKGWESGGGIVGFVKAHWTLSPVSVSYCTVDRVTVESTKRFVGGIIGGFGDTKITLSDCSVTRTRLISTNENPNLVSGFIGNGWGNIIHTVTNCFTDSSVHPVTATSDEESFNTIESKVAYSNVYTSANKNFEVEGVTYISSDDELKGNSASKVLKGFDFKNDWSETDSDYPVIKKSAGSWIYDSSLPGKVWSGKISRYYDSGEGSKEDPYIIKTGGQLALLANDALNGKTLNRYYKITENIILNDTSSDKWKEKANEWYTGAWAQAFRGHLDGGYHTVSGLYLNKNQYNYNGKDYYGGLFACLGKNAVIENLGIVNSSIVFGGTSKYVGAFAGFIDQYDAANATYDEYPLIRKCFADTTVYLDASSCGGFIGCATRPVRVENAFFTGKVNQTARGLFGYSRMNAAYEDVLVKNFYTADSKQAVLSNASYDNIKCENCYSSTAQDKDGLTRLFIDRMCGEEAKKNMKGFDFDKVWTVRASDETPGLKGFASDSYNNVMKPVDIVVSFETYCDLTVKSMTGKAYSKLVLPVLKRDGYRFDGWYAYPELDVPYDYDYYPTFDTILYAKWTLLGFEQNFEQYDDTEYDYDEDYEYYRPTVSGYSAKYVHGGAKSMHRIGDSDEDQDFLLFYEEELEIGKTYKMEFYLSTDQSSASVDLALVHLDWPDIYSSSNTVARIGNISGIKDGEWTKCTYTFVAKSKWIAIRTSGGNSLYFDDFILFDTSDPADTLVILDSPKDSESYYESPTHYEPQKEIEDKNEDNSSSNADSTTTKSKTTKKAEPNAEEDNTLAIVLIISAAALIIISGGIVTTILILKKRKSHKLTP